MNLTSQLMARSESKCELCGNTSALDAYPVFPRNTDNAEDNVLICDVCAGSLASPADNPAHWRCLSESIWSEVPAVKVLAWRTLSAISAQSWAQDLLDTMYMDDETMEWANNTGGDNLVHRDSNGNVLITGDSVLLIKDLDVKGANFVAKRGTLVKKIALVEDNAQQIEGNVNGQRIVILTQFVKKA